MMLFAGIETPIGLAALAGGVILGLLLARWREKCARSALAQQEQQILQNARREAEAITREARLAATEEAMKLRQENEQALAARRREVSEAEQRLAQREALLAQQLKAALEREAALETQKQECQRKAEILAQQQEDLAALMKQQRERLESLCHLSAEAARAELLREVEAETAHEAAALARRILEEARHTADEKARFIVSLAIQRYSGSLTFESTTATIALPGEEIKGRIIGREGRNIRAFENATGVTVLIDDTPNAVVLSGFDPVRREIAREAMQRLIQDGRIHPTRIEEVVAKVTQEMDETIYRYGEQAALRAGVNSLHPEILKVLGRLHFRHSFSQNILEHSVEVAHLAGLMAGELGVDVALSKRAGLLHDIGKAVSHEVEGAHALVGAELIKRHGEPEVVVKAVAAHHGDVEVDGPISAILAAADAISASRPGARIETMTTYLKRVEDLERIGRSFPGVDKCFAVQAGRELRVLVQPERVDDAQALVLARNIARQIEEELQYPGQIKVVVLRETRCVELAK
ncbi:ribonuclease Y [Fontisphaera persica]|uniref:ribonuclease Y n=1 Tax=Fontisphaera persica TaxID=2974023 RepID=UPI0024C08F3D|nr:ribonuclease Y [Fontisphaera persica]WCJ58783.1 ribonuclease Y [Fontisphaera persica]